MHWHILSHQIGYVNIVMQENIYLHIYIPRVSSDTVIPYTIFTKIDTIKSEQRHSFIYMGMHIFTFMHLADAFIQSDLQCIQAIHFFCKYVCSLGIEPTIFALLTQCSATEPQEHDKE